MYVDASAFAAILLAEPEADDIADRIDAAQTKRITSGVSIFEATLAVARVRSIPIPAAFKTVVELAGDAGIEVVPILIEEAENALRAFQDYGKGTGHKARLNMGDCFAYGCAVVHQAPLLFKGDDFTHTPLGARP
jgi:ribonuclease VapC